MRADVLPAVPSILPARLRTLGVCAALLALACTAFALLAPAGAFAASPLAAGPLNVSAGTAQDGRIATGDYHTCAIKTDGTPVCWGADGAVNSGQTAVPAGLGPVTQITAGGYHTCAIKTDGTPVCWGRNSDGQTTLPSDIGTVTQIAAGGYHTCAIKTDGTPACWGRNSEGQTTLPAGIGTVTQITAGGFHTCAIKTDGTPTCWGNNPAGQTTIPAGTGTVTQITAGGFHTCAIKTDGTPTCWGNNENGRTTIPAGTGTVTQITAGGFHTCAIKTDGTPTCWGFNGNGQATIPTGTGTTTQITAGFTFTCAIKTDGTPTCWGSNGYGQTTVPAGTGTVSVPQISSGAAHSCAVSPGGRVRCWGLDTFGQANVPGDLGAVIQVSAGDTHTCAIKTDGTVRCWGLSNLGQANVPADLGPVTRITAGGQHSCAIRPDGTVRCWGSNNIAQVTVPGDVGTVTQIDAGSAHSCAVRTNGTVRCWGSTSNNRSTPPGDLGTVSSIDVGDRHSCAIRTDGTARCWGNDSSGESTIPADLGAVSQITAGTLFTCARTVAGTVRCWGSTASGRLDVPGDLGAVTHVSAGIYGGCAVQISGRVRCWGDNSTGRSAVSITNAPPALLGAGSVNVQLSTTPFAGRFAITSGSLPNGLTLSPTGQITGTPTTNNQTATVTITPSADGIPPAQDRTFTITTDLTKPTTSDNVPTAWQNSPVTVTLTASDTGGSGVKSTTYEIVSAAGTPGATQTYDPASKPVLNHGEKIRYRSTDEAGNTEADKTSGAAKVDTAKPTTSDNVPTAWQNTPVTVTLTASDTGGSGVKTTTYEVVSAAGTPGATKTYDAANKPTLSNGEKIRYRTTDEAGNTEADKTSGAAKVDTAKPTTSDNVPTAWQNTPVTVTLTASDTGGSGVKTTTYEIVNAAGTPGATKTYDAANKPTLSNGEKIRYRSTDEAGNVEADKTSAAAKVDTSAPTTTDNVPAGFVNAPVTVTLTASDTGGSGVKTTTYEILNAAGTPGATKTYDPASKPALSNGEKIRYRSQSNAGVTEADKTSSAAKVDTDAPNTTDDVPTAFQSGPVTVTLTTTDTGGSGVKTTTFEIVDAAGNPGPTKVYDPANKPVLGDGEKIRYRSSDTAGNTEADKTSAAAKVDAKVPTATITTAPALSSAERSPTVAFTSDGVDATYQCSVDDAPFTTCTSPLTLGPLADGQHTFRVRAISRAGVTGPIATATFTIAQPVVVTAPAAAQTPAAPVPVPTLQLLGGGQSPQILLNKRSITVRVTCGPVPCTLKIATTLRANNTTRVRLKTRTITLNANQTRTLRIATTKTQRRIIRRLVGRRGTGGQARFTLTATTTNGTTATTIVRIGLRRLANQ